VPRHWAGERIVLRFDAATHRADVRVAEHEGGYMPFEADVTGHLRAGGTARLTVVVNNEPSRASLVVGEHIWNVAGFATQPAIVRVDGNRKGVLTRDRRPKSAAFAVRRRRRGV
jgi:beta-galactosidase/beta-glucuronidase